MKKEAKDETQNFKLNDWVRVFISPSKNKAVEGVGPQERRGAQSRTQ